MLDFLKDPPVHALRLGWKVSEYSSILLPQSRPQLEGSVQPPVFR